MEIINKIATKVNLAGGRCFFVGGFVRDMITGRESKDIDIEVFHLSLNELEGILKSFGHIKEVGKQFGILKLAHYPHIDFALPRAEQKKGEKHADFEITINPQLPYHLAARRRDFTCNALMQDILTGEILDYFQGIKDIENKIIRHIADDTFVEDQLRGLRAAQLTTRLKFQIATKTKKLIQSFSYEHLSVERIQGELQKGILAKNTHYFLSMLTELDIIPKILFQLADLQLMLPQKYAKIQEIIECIDRKIPKTFSSTQILVCYLSILIFYLSEEKELLQFFTSHKLIIRKSVKLKQNLQAIMTIENESDLRKLKNQLTDPDVFWFLFPIMSNCLENFLPIFYPTKEKFSLAYQKAIQNNPINQPLIQGKDLIALGFKPGPMFSQILSLAFMLEEKQGLTKAEIIIIIKKIII